MTYISCIGIILGIDSASESRLYVVTPPLICWANTQHDPCVIYFISLRPYLNGHHFANIFESITRNTCIFDSKFTELCSKSSTWNSVSIGLCNSLIQNRGKAITSTNDDQVCWHIILVNTLRPRQNGRHFADDIFKCIFFNENVWILIKISLKFVPKGPINNIPALVQIMAGRCSGYKPLSEPMMVSLPIHKFVTRPQLVNGFFLTSYFENTNTSLK